MRVALLHPEWDRSCEVCERYVPRDDGSFVPNRRTGLPLLRTPGTPTPCHKCEKVPASARKQGLDWRELRKQAIELTPQNRAAWRFYRECRASGQFPDDPIVRWYSAILLDIEERADRQPLDRLTTAILTLAVQLTARKR